MVKILSFENGYPFFWDLNINEYEDVVPPRIFKLHRSNIICVNNCSRGVRQQLAVTRTLRECLFNVEYQI